jgi:hypothetical protein
MFLFLLFRPEGFLGRSGISSLRFAKKGA